MYSANARVFLVCSNRAQVFKNLTRNWVLDCVCLRLSTCRVQRCKKGQSISMLFTPVRVKPRKTSANVGEELTGSLKKLDLLKIISAFIRDPEIKVLALENGIDETICEKGLFSFRNYCLESTALPTDLHVIFSDIINSAGNLKDIFPFFLRHVREVFPHLECVDDLKKIGDIRQPANWYPEARKLQRKFYFHCGPTNSGKTYKAIQSFLKAKSGIYCAPLKLLAMEVHQKAQQENVPCDLLTGEEVILVEESGDFSSHLSCTIEMCPLDKKFDVAVIDEIQMLRDVQRGWAWTRALLGLKAEEIHICGEEAAVHLVDSILCTTNENLKIKKYERLSKLHIDAPVESLSNVRPGDCIVCFNKNDIYSVVQSLEALKNKVAIIYGSLPPQTKLAQCEKFNDPKNPCNVLVATDAVGMGLNLNIRRVVFYSLMKVCTDESGEMVKRIISVSQALQIAGRAGRFGSVHQEGYVTTFRKKDLKTLELLLAQKPEAILQAGLLPTVDQIELFSYYLPNSSLSSLIDIFYSLCTVDDSLYFMCDLKVFKILAELIDHIPLPLKVKFIFCCAPVNNKLHFIHIMFVRFAKMYSLNQAVSAEWVCQKIGWPIKKPENIREFAMLETIHELLELYLWLSNRFEDFFPDATAIRNIQIQVDSLIQVGVLNMAKLSTTEESCPSTDEKENIKFERKSPSCQEEENEQERPTGSALEELQRQVEEELKNSDQVLSRIGSMYSRSRSPAPPEKSYHEALADNAQMSNFQTTPRSPVSNRSRRETPGSHPGGVTFPPTENLVNNIVPDDIEYAEPPVAENCEMDDGYYNSTDKDPYYAPAAEEMTVEPSNAYASRGSPAPNSSALHTSFDRVQSFRSGNESQHRNVSGQSAMVSDPNLRGPPTVMGSAGRGSVSRGSAGRGSLVNRSAPGMASAAMGSGSRCSPGRDSAGRGASSRIGCSESDCPGRISQGLDPLARSTTLSGRVESQGQNMQAQCFTDQSNVDHTDAVYLDIPEEQLQGTQSTLAGAEGHPCQTTQSSRIRIKSQLYQRPPNLGAACGGQLYQRSPKPMMEAGGQPCPTPQSPRIGPGGQPCPTPQSTRIGPGGQPCPTPQSPRIGPGGQPCPTPQSPRIGPVGQSYQRAPIPDPGAWDNCYSRAQSPEAGEADQAFQRNLSPTREPLGPVYPRPSSLEAAYGGQYCQGAQSPGVGAISQPYQVARSPRAGVGFQPYQRDPSPVTQMTGYGGQLYERSPKPVTGGGGQPCQTAPNSVAGAGVQLYQEESPTAEPWDNFYSYPQSPQAGAGGQPHQRGPVSMPETGGQHCHTQPSPGARAGSQSYQKAQTPTSGAGGQPYQRAQTPVAVTGGHLHPKEPNMGFDQFNIPERPGQIESSHHNHNGRGHSPNEKKTQALCRLSQLRKTPSLAACEVDKGLDFLKVCCPKAKIPGKVVKIPERPCLKKHEIEKLIKCEARDVDDALFLSTDVNATYKKPCPKQQKAQMSVQALVKAHAKQVCQAKTYSPLEHPDLEDISPELAAAMMFSQEQGIRMEECPYDIVTHLYPDETEAPFSRKSRQSNVSVVDSQKEQEEIIEKSASVPSDGVSDSAYSRKMKERGEEIEARSSYDVELAIGQTKRQYVLVTQKPERFNRIQFRGAGSPLWFPGYFSAFPDQQGLSLVPSPSEVFEKAWVHSNPKNMPNNDVIVLD